MPENTRHREAFITIRGLLQEHDPHGLMGHYAGDRFDNEIYGYEATTLLERARSDRSSTAVLSELNAIASASRRQVDQERSNVAAAKISEVINAL